VIDVTIVLLNWNSGPVVFDAGASALAQTGVRTELLIVDNGSTDGSLDELKARFPQARYLPIGFNSGFTGGMNTGTDAAQGRYILWQNADLVLAPDYCARGVAVIESSDRVGAVGGLVTRLVDGVRTAEFDAAGYTLTQTHRARFLSISTASEAVGISGSCPIFRRTALDSVRRIVGYVLDPWYFTYGEDIDLMIRLNLAGWSVRYEPAMRAWHVRSASTVAGSRFYEKPDSTQIHHFKNRLATVVKTLPRPVLLKRLPALAATELAIPLYLLLRRPKSVRNWARAWRAVWAERGRLLRDRAAIQSRASPEVRARLERLLATRADSSL
jgi:GT2 family glycosyltransferase